jgi:hypothetical protein
MSGNAALSAARKRRASSTPGTGISAGAGAGAGMGAQSSAYYSRTTPTFQQLMNQTFPEDNVKQPQYMLPKEKAPNVPINIYENIELIKQQISARTTLIQTQGSAIPPDKLRVLQKQNEIQNQILIQKMAIAKKMEQVEQEQLRQKEQELQHQMSQMALPSMNEPEFIYEKGIPRKNPKYKTPEEIEAIKQAMAQGQAQARTGARAHTMPVTKSSSQMTPFVSMITDTGVIPPPIVILKSHDAKLAEHDNIMREMIQHLDYLLEKTAGATSEPARAQHATTTSSEADAADADEPEQELLMEVVINDLTNSREFVEGIVDKIVNETNLSEVIMKIEPLVKENQELRSLIYSQQQMMNEMNTMLLRLLNSNGSSTSSSSSSIPLLQTTESENSQEEAFQDDGLDGDGLYQHTEMTEIVLSVDADAHGNMDTEPAQIIDLDAPEAEAEADAQPEAEPEAEPEADAEDEYSEMPHFPIALIVNEIDSPARA